MGFLKQHVLPLLIALILGGLFINSDWVKSRVYSSYAPVDTVIPSETYYPYFSHGLNTELWLRSHLKNKSVVVLGSSELTAQTRTYIPNRFLTDSLNIPCIAFGKGGNQCFSIFCQLLSFNKSLEGSRIVIILSPGWFDEYSEGTALEMFLLYNNRRTLDYILEDDSIPDQFKNYVGSYVHENMPSIGSPDETLMQFYYQHKRADAFQWGATYPFASFHRLAWKTRNDLSEKAYAQHLFPYPGTFAVTEKLLPTTNEVPADFPVPPVNWDSLSRAAQLAFTQISSNNTIGVENDYYDTWIRNKPLKKNKDISIEDNVEYRDFLMLTELLSYYKADAFFIIQALNPHAFEAPQKLDPVIVEIEKALTARHFSYYNMYTSDKDQYVKGTLNDIMHTGELGWIKADSAIVHHYFKTGRHEN